MPLIDLKCTACDHAFEHMRPLVDYPATPPCPACASPTIQYHPSPRGRSTAPPIIVFQAPDGTVRFPGDAHGAMAQSYRQVGYREIEIRGAAAMRHFESRMNAHERSILARKIERRQAAREARESDLRSELRRRMPQMTERGRALARATMRANDHKPREQAEDANFHSEVYSFDRSNRDESRGPDGRKHRD